MDKRIMQLIEIKENRFQKIHNKFKLLSKEKQDLENKKYRVEERIKSLEWKRDRDLREQKKTHAKANKDYKSRTKITVSKINPDSMNTYNEIRFKLNPDADKVIAGKRFEKELSKFKNIQKTHVRILMVARNNYLRITVIQPRKIKFKYGKQIDIETDKKKKLTKDIWNSSKKMKPYIKVLQITERNREKIKRHKKGIRETNKKYKELEKVKPVWKGMRQADDYYSKKEKITDKFIDLDLKKERLENEINKLSRETNKELFSIRL